MKILLNFIPLKTGGGVQVALDFISNISKFGANHEWYLIVTEGTEFLKIDLPKNCELIHVVPNKLTERARFEFFTSKRLVSELTPDVIYTQFGPHWNTSVKNVVGCAYSNLFYPEIDFWNALPFHKRFIKKSIDIYRKNKLRQADKVIFETEDLAVRSVEQGFLDVTRVSYVLPAASSLVSLESNHPETLNKLIGMRSGFNFCLISGYHPNKNIELLIDAIPLLNLKLGHDNFNLLLTLPEDNPSVKSLFQKAECYGVRKQIHNIGPIPQQGCCEVYKASDAAILPSILESFSNNIAEAWAMKVPLLISDMSWSRSLCNDSAHYFDCYDSNDVASKMYDVILSDSLCESLVDNGRARIQDYPTSQQRFQQYLTIIEDAV